MTIVDIELTDVKSFSVDLQVEADKHRVFLRALHKLGITTQFLDETSVEDSVFRYYRRLQGIGSNALLFCGGDKDFVGEALFRYSRLWLPLVARAKKDNDNNIDLIPPPDIAWLWHCHRLAPYRYSDHVKTLFPDCYSTQDSIGLLDPSHPFVFQLDSDIHTSQEDSNDTWSENYLEIAKRTRNLFGEMYPGEPFFYGGSSVSFRGVDSNPEELRLLSGYDLLSTCQRQATFLWQISGEAFSSTAFIQEGIDNYIRFVKLSNHPSRSEPELCLVPTYQIDWLWHTHILASIAGYHEDIGRITGGAVLDHDDSINDRTKGGVLDTSYHETTRLWNEVYGRNYVVAGGMYKGEPPVEYYRRDYYFQRILVNGENSSVSADIEIDATQWMPPGHVLAFIPYDQNNNTWKAHKAHPKKKDYVFGNGYQGIGYYHMNTREAIRVVRYRCDRELKQAKESIGTIIFVSLYSAVSFATHGYPVFAPLILLVCGIPIKYKYDRLVMWRQTRSEAFRRLFAVGPTSTSDIPDVIERGVYHLHNDKDNTMTQIPFAETLVDAAGCGMSSLYERRKRGRNSTLFGAAGCAGGGHGGGDGGGGCGGGGCGGGGCGGGGCGG